MSHDPGGPILLGFLYLAAAAVIVGLCFEAGRDLWRQVVARPFRHRTRPACAPPLEYHREDRQLTRDELPPIYPGDKDS